MMKLNYIYTCERKRTICYGTRTVMHVDSYISKHIKKQLYIFNKVRILPSWQFVWYIYIYTGDFKAFDRFIALKAELVPVQLCLNTCKLPLFVDWIIIYDKSLFKVWKSAICRMPFLSLSPSLSILERKTRSCRVFCPFLNQCFQPNGVYIRIPPELLGDKFPRQEKEKVANDCV